MAPALRDNPAPITSGSQGGLQVLSTNNYALTYQPLVNDKWMQHHKQVLMIMGDVSEAQGTLFMPSWLLLIIFYYLPFLQLTFSLHSALAVTQLPNTPHYC